MRIWLASYPRSGNTFFRICWRYFYDLPTFSVHRDHRAQNSQEMRELIGVEGVEHPQGGLELCKTHRLEGGQSIPSIYIVRDGREACVSYAKHLGVSVEQVIKGSVRFGGWSDHVMYWMAMNPVVVKFEDLIADPAGVLDRTTRSLGITLAHMDGAPPSFSDLHGKNPDFFRSGQTDSWRDELTEEQLELFWYHNRPGMKCLYPEES